MTRENIAVRCNVSLVSASPRLARQEAYVQSVRSARVHACRVENGISLSLLLSLSLSLLLSLSTSHTRRSLCDLLSRVTATIYL